MKTDVMKEAERVFTHEKCGGAVRREEENGRYVCDRCQAEGARLVSSAERVEGKREEVLLCDSHDESF